MSGSIHGDQVWLYVIVTVCADWSKNICDQVASNGCASEGIVVTKKLIKNR